MLRITLAMMFWIMCSIFSSTLFFYSDHNAILTSLIMLPGILPIVPLLFPAPKHGCRWMYICIAIIIQLGFYFFDLLSGNLDALFFAVTGVSLLYYIYFIKNNKVLALLGAIICMCLFYPLGKQLYIYNILSIKDMCFSHEEYCGSSCYKDYSVISCKTQKWKEDVFHGSPGSYYFFDIVDGDIYVYFGDSSNRSEYLFRNGEIKKQ